MGLIFALISLYTLKCPTVNTGEDTKVAKQHEYDLKKAKELKEQQEKILKEKYELEKKQKEEAEWIPVRLSFYTNDVHDCGKTDGITASGKNISRGGNFIAAPIDIPFNTIMYIEGYGEYEVVDRGGDIHYDNGVMKLDVFVTNATQAEINELGVKYTKARILK